jgi:hypothetical protein
MVIYCHYVVIPSLCVTKLYYLGNYLGTAVNYHGICVTIVIRQYCRISTIKVGLNYRGNVARYFYNIGSRASATKEKKLNYWQQDFVSGRILETKIAGKIAASLCRCLVKARYLLEKAEQFVFVSAVYR